MIKDIPALVSKITSEIAAFTDIATLGMSGGADSTLMAILCAKALGPENVRTLHMPYGLTDYETFNAKSSNIATYLSLNVEWTNIGSSVRALSQCILRYAPLSTLNSGNMRSRMRMVALYTYACSIAEDTGLRVRVMGTGNMSEDYIGYDTKGGDSIADIFPIGDLFKSEVYQLLDYFVEQGVIIEDMIDREPSAGLWEGQKDSDELEHTYNEMEPAIVRALSGSLDFNLDVDVYVWKRHLANKHKHEATATIDLSEFKCEETLNKMRYGNV